MITLIVGIVGMIIGPAALYAVLEWLFTDKQPASRQHSPEPEDDPWAEVMVRLAKRNADTHD